MKYVKQYRWTIGLLAILIIIFIINRNTGLEALRITGNNIFTVLLVLPPTLILIGLLDVWIPRETMILHMGEESGWKGFLLAFLLGSVAAGPLFVAFPIAAVLAKKGVRLACILFFMGTWVSAKLPLVMFEASNMGWLFTMLHLGTSLPLYLLGSFIIEKIVNKKEVTDRLSEKMTG